MKIVACFPGPDPTDVREYWILDPEAETSEVLRRASEGRLERVAELRRSAGDRLATPLLPGLEVLLVKGWPRGAGPRGEGARSPAATPLTTCR